ncbi:hypothetical protein R3P38DRAFT_3459345 [Favolaschia claudopus]|uniref:Uncharacterized protein n=1 Tax=Favolaschia claudopus TaxID=2862362 RepID=A0AAV9ZIV7_9AGAR
MPQMNAFVVLSTPAKSVALSLARRQYEWRMIKLLVACSCWVEALPTSVLRAACDSLDTIVTRRRPRLVSPPAFGARRQHQYMCDTAPTYPRTVFPLRDKFAASKRRPHPAYTSARTWREWRRTGARLPSSVSRSTRLQTYSRCRAGAREMSSLPWVIARSQGEEKQNFECVVDGVATPASSCCLPLNIDLLLSTDPEMRSGVKGMCPLLGSCPVIHPVLSMREEGRAGIDDLVRHPRLRPTDSDSSSRMSTALDVRCQHRHALIRGSRASREHASRLCVPLLLIWLLYGKGTGADEACSSYLYLDTADSHSLHQKSSAASEDHVSELPISIVFPPPCLAPRDTDEAPLALSLRPSLRGFENRQVEWIDTSPVLVEGRKGGVDMETVETLGGIRSMEVEVKVSAGRFSLLPKSHLTGADVLQVDESTARGRVWEGAEDSEWVGYRRDTLRGGTRVQPRIGCRLTQDAAALSFAQPASSFPQAQSRLVPPFAFLRPPAVAPTWCTGSGRERVISHVVVVNVDRAALESRRGGVCL